MSLLRRLSSALACSLLLAAGACDDAPAAKSDDAVTVPSGRAIQFQDVIANVPGSEGATARFRFIVPDLAAEDDWVADMEALCTTYALPRVAGNVPAPQQIIISLSDRAVPFGEADPDAVQFFEAYGIKDGICIWEVF